MSRLKVGRLLSRDAGLARVPHPRATIGDGSPNSLVVGTHPHECPHPFSSSRELSGRPCLCLIGSHELVCATPFAAGCLAFGLLAKGFLATGLPPGWSSQSEGFDVARFRESRACPRCFRWPARALARNWARRSPRGRGTCEESQLQKGTAVSALRDARRRLGLTLRLDDIPSRS